MQNYSLHSSSFSFFTSSSFLVLIFIIFLFPPSHHARFFLSHSLHFSLFPSSPLPISTPSLSLSFALVPFLPLSTSSSKLVPLTSPLLCIVSASPFFFPSFFPLSASFSPSRLSPSLFSLFILFLCSSSLSLFPFFVPPHFTLSSPHSRPHYHFSYLSLLLPHLLTYRLTG